jgi:hypothetical protein
MTTNNHDKPVDEVRLGRITATIWRNRTTDEGIFYSTQITRLFRRGTNWDRSPSFGRDDLLTVAKVADMANTRIHELQAEARIGRGIRFRAPFLEGAERVVRRDPSMHLGEHDSPIDDLVRQFVSWLQPEHSADRLRDGGLGLGSQLTDDHDTHLGLVGHVFYGK